MNVLKCLLVVAAVSGLISCQIKSVHEPVPLGRAPAPPVGKKPPQTSLPPSRPPVAPELPTAPEGTPVPATLQTAVQLEQSGRYLDALREYVRGYSNSVHPEEQELYRRRALDVLQTRLDEKTLEAVTSDNIYGFARAHALYELAFRHQEHGNSDQARRYYGEVLKVAPGGELAFQAEQALMQLERYRSVSPQTIGVVLPLTGRNAAIGQKALRGIQLGLRMHDPNSNFKLAIIDSEGNPDAARRGVERLVTEDNTIAIIGSLLSKTAPAVSAKAAEYGVPVIGLSQRAGITETGPSIFRNALTSEMQVRQLVRSAIDEMGLRRFAILAPNDAYGVEYANLFWDEVAARGGNIVAAQFYDPKRTDFRAEAQRLVNTWYIEGRADEYKQIMREHNQGQSKRGRVRREKNVDDVLPPIVDFQAVFIPDSVKMMNTLSAFLSYAGVRNVKLLGTNLWNTPSVARQAGLFSDQIVFVDSWNSAEVANSGSRVVAEYQKVFGETPSLIEIQAYDSALILRSLIAQGAGTREALVRQLTDLRRFPGALGYLDMSGNREILRPISTYAISGGQIRPLKAKR